MSLSPFPNNDDVVTRDSRRVTDPWWRWFHALLTETNTHETRIAALEAQVTALEARVAALEGP